MTSLIVSATSSHHDTEIHAACVRLLMGHLQQADVTGSSPKWFTSGNVRLSVAAELISVDISFGRQVVFDAVDFKS
jgi:hypothetical protein